MLTDLNISILIAEIEALDVILHDGKLYFYECASIGNGMMLRGEFNATTDDSLCFKYCKNDRIHVDYDDFVPDQPRMYFAVRGNMITANVSSAGCAVMLAKLEYFEK